MQMKKVLLITVGGSPQPIIDSVTKHQPDYIVFLCTARKDGDEGSYDSIYKDTTQPPRKCPKCGHTETTTNKALASALGLSNDRFETLVVEADKPFDTYKKACDLIEKFQHNGWRVIADYTGGTKSMSAGLLLAAVEYKDIVISLVAGPRKDLIKIRDGEQVCRRVNNKAVAFRQSRQALAMAREWNYPAAINLLDELCHDGLDDEVPDFNRLRNLCRGFGYWDTFIYDKAYEYLKPFGNDGKIQPLIIKLSTAWRGLQWYSSPTSGKFPGYVLVYDVLANAERRAARGSYDDAIARIYRALEMYAQFCLLAKGLNSSNLDTAKLPEPIRPDYEARRNAKGEIQIGLVEDYELLAKLGDPVGQTWLKHKGKVLEALQKRNYSFLAHGINPLTQTDYKYVKDAIWPFISECDEVQKVKNGLSGWLDLNDQLKCVW
ncbi:hypothetical protein TcarDRAFT_2595 [Thermosinus carboxydivorans Nor1]|uniref:CRISPR-associated protein, TIGR02710 family n=1 Tax=Thermosinus carboxydivorans Nor1 TaxID=401526 RepID=A1HM57_9FIRM|nr:TIGR02710 family CRISPR-associated CARF protein [Thermosinus carboxydivorans]EAX48906.1 hypothetical protein TcarDRAFT_2595 [Thermosinus carboxydivorans Nor1]